MVTARVYALKARAEVIKGMDLRVEKRVVESMVRSVEKEWEERERRWIVCVDMVIF